MTDVNTKAKLLDSKTEVLKNIKSCEISILALEKERNICLFNRKHEFRSTYCALEEIDARYWRDRCTKKQELKQELARINAAVRALQRTLNDMKPDPEFVEKLKQSMETVEASIMCFKEKQRIIFESLILEEQKVTQEVTAFERKLDSWSSIPQILESEPAQVNRALLRPASSSIPPAVIAYERFIQQTGRQESWTDYDHLVFLKIRATHNNGGPAFLDAVARELPTKTPKEIAQHEQWYIEFSTLLERKKRAIEAWREQKLTQKKVGSPNETEGSLAPKQSVVDEILVKEREERFSKLSAWKAEQKLKQAKAEEERLKLESETMKKKEREDRRRVILKRQVEEYAKVKEAELNEARSREEAKEARNQAHKRLATKEIAVFRERDMQAIIVKKRKAEMDEIEKREREKKLERLKEKVKVPRDPNRLYKLTAGWEERKKAEPESGKGGAGMSMPRRAIPSWRQGL